MNYRDFFKKASVKDVMSLLPEGVAPSDFKKAIAIENKTLNNVFISAKLASQNLSEDANYYKNLYEEFSTEFSDDEDESGLGAALDAVDDNGGLPKVGGALAIPHHGQPIMMGKIIQVGGEFKDGKPASGELSGMTAANGGVAKDTGGLPVQNNSKEPITAGGKAVDSSIASKSVGGNVVPGEGQKQGGPNSQGTIASTAKLNEGKETIRKMVKEVLKEIRFDKESGKWVRINEDCKDAAGFPTSGAKGRPQYKVAGPQYRTAADVLARTTQFEPEITEMYDDEEEMKLNERYVELANAQRNLSETELAELTSLREKIDQMQVGRRNDGLSRGGVDPNIYENENWIKGAVNPEHKGYCTPMSKATCTPHRKAFAKRAKAHDLEENGAVGHRDAAMKMGPAYSIGNQPQYRTVDDDQAHRNQDTPACTNENELAECDCDDPNHAHNQMQEQDKDNLQGLKCPECHSDDLNVMSPGEQGGGGETMTGGSAICNNCGHAWNTTDEEDNPLPPDQHGMDEAGGGAVQHSSYRTANHGNLPQEPDQRWANDLDEGESKTAKKIAKGQKGKTSMFSQNLKHQKPKKTSSGVHKRKS